MFELTRIMGIDQFYGDDKKPIMATIPQNPKLLEENGRIHLVDESGCCGTFSFGDNVFTSRNAAQDYLRRKYIRDQESIDFSISGVIIIRGADYSFKDEAERLPDVAYSYRIYEEGHGTQKVEV